MNPCDVTDVTQQSRVRPAPGTLGCHAFLSVTII
jgi:hypothetical protein